VNKKEALAQLKEHLSEAPVGLGLKEYALKSWEEQAEDVDGGHWMNEVFMVWISSKEGPDFWNAISNKDWQEALDKWQGNDTAQHCRTNPDRYEQPKQIDKDIIDMVVDLWGSDFAIKYCGIRAIQYREELLLNPEQPIELDLEKAKWYEAKAKELKQKPKP
jgi:hypothetical protein